jgi:hypothetical protein
MDVARVPSRWPRGHEFVMARGTLVQVERDERAWCVEVAGSSGTTTSPPGVDARRRGCPRPSRIKIKAKTDSNRPDVAVRHLA